MNRGLPDWIYLDGNRAGGRGEGVGDARKKRRFLADSLNFAFGVDKENNNINSSNDINNNNADDAADSNSEDDDDEDEFDDQPHPQTYFYMAHLHSLLFKTKYNCGVDLRAVAIPREENRCAGNVSMN